jgi:hypothetical protein
MDNHYRVAEAKEANHAAAWALTGIGIMVATALVSLGLIVWALKWLAGKLAGL